MVFGVAATGILQGFIFCNMRVKSTSLRLAAMARAQEKIEQIEVDSYANITAGNYPDETNLTLDTAGTSATGDDLFGARTVAIINEVVGAATNYKEITVTVSWYFRGNRLTESLTTLKNE